MKFQNKSSKFAWIYNLGSVNLLIMESSNCPTPIQILIHWRILQPEYLCFFRFELVIQDLNQQNVVKRPLQFIKFGQMVAY